MRTLVFLAMAMALVGCKKSKPTTPDTAPPPAQPNGGGSGGSGIVNPQGNLSVSGAGSGVGLQGPRKAAARILNQAELKDLHLSMFTAFSLDNRVPDLNEVMNDVRQNPKLMSLVKDEVIYLTGSTLADGIWAYTQYPQRAGNHFVVTRSGVEDLDPDELKKRLQAQKSEVKLSK